MRIHFSISYKTNDGECVCVNFSGKTIFLSTMDGDIWNGVWATAGKDIAHYYYAIYRDGICVRREPGSSPHTANLGLKCEDLFLNDWWIENSWPKAVESAALKCVYRHGEKAQVAHWTPGNTEFCIHALPPLHNKSLTYAILGNAESLGAWDERKAIPLTYADNFCYSVSLHIPDKGIEYKYVLWNRDEQKVLEWEEGKNRTCQKPDSTKKSAFRYDDGTPRLSQHLWKGAGIVVPLFSLRSKSGFGFGDFGDLSKLISWASSTRMSCIQLLPINDTTRTHTWNDSYPYNSISVMALHPLYLDLRQLDITLSRKQEIERARLNGLPTIDYEGVERIKTELLNIYYATHREELTTNTQYKKFVRQQKEWLLPYAAFCYLRDLHGTADFRTWALLSVYSESGIKKLMRRPDAADRITYHCVVQYLLSEQLERAHAQAAEEGVILKGDIPIGISRDSVPAWVDGHLFNFNGQAGAPPDMFATEGQNWGFPTYRWEAMKKENYNWWTQRLRRMSTYFDAYRIDHVLGFFRIWEIPYGREDGILGHFVPALPFSGAELEERGLSPCNGQIFNATENINKNANEVLFIEDEELPGHYHPSIAGQRSVPYKNLSSNEKRAYDALFQHFFYERHNDFWKQGAMQKLPAVINASHMLACAEDLGMVPASVKETLEELQILSLEIERMPKDPALVFGQTERNAYLSVATISTHDMPPLRLWWKQNPEAAQHYYEWILHGIGNAPELLSGAQCEQVVYRHLSSPSMLCLLAFQDWLSIDEHNRAQDITTEQINDPANPHQNWCYRMHIPMEELVSLSDLNEKIRGLIIKSGR